MRIYEAVNLVNAETFGSIEERRYNDCPAHSDSIQWWGVLTIAVQNQLGQVVRNVPVPFRISATTREEAFANFEASRLAAAPGAQAQVKEIMERAARRAQSEIILAKATDRVPVLQQ